METYIGLKENSKPAIFKSETAPTKATHPQYEIIYGPFKTQEDAERYVNAMSELACGDA